MTNPQKLSTMAIVEFKNFDLNNYDKYPLMTWTDLGYCLDAPDALPIGGTTNYIKGIFAWREA